MPDHIFTTINLVISQQLDIQKLYPFWVQHLAVHESSPAPEFASPSSPDMIALDQSIGNTRIRQSMLQAQKATFEANIQREERISQEAQECLDIHLGVLHQVDEELESLDHNLTSQEGARQELLRKEMQAVR